MSDVSKAQKLKLVNSRKRFKELQELKKKKDANQNRESTPESRSKNDTPVDMNSNPTPLNGSPVHSPSDTISPPNTISVTVPPNYFTGTSYVRSDQHPTLFFDNLSQENEEPSSVLGTNVFNYFNEPRTVDKSENGTPHILSTSNTRQDNSDPIYTGGYTLFSQSNQNDYTPRSNNVVDNTKDVPSLDDPEIQQNDLFELHNNGTPVQEPAVIPQQEDDISIDYAEFKPNSLFDMHNNSNQGLFSQQNFENLLDYTLRGNAEPTSESENLDIEKEIMEITNEAQAEIQCNTESVQRYSNQIAECSDSKYETSTALTDLEKRNVELNKLLEQEMIKNSQQQFFINDLQNMLAEMSELKREVNTNDNSKRDREIDELSDDLKCHRHAVSVLVAEKSELTDKIAQLEENLKQKTAETEELQARLKASRSRVAELEREVNVLKTEKARFENSEQLQNNQIVTLRSEYSQLRDQKEELFQDLLEAKEKCKTLNEQNEKWQSLNKELSNNLSLAQIKIQQITNNTDQMSDNQLEAILLEKKALEKQVADLNASLAIVNREREESSIHYQQYAQQLNVQLTALSNRVEQLHEENENLVKQEQNRIRHIGELEKQLQSLQNEGVGFSSSRVSNDVHLKSELEAARQILSRLENDNVTLNENYTRTRNEKDMLTRELEAKREIISELETEVDRLRGNQPDSAKLLATMESDKVAAAAAVRQNMEMKEQVEGMREVIAKMDNDKVDLTEKLTFEMASNKDLLEKLQRTELQLQRLTDAIEIKDRELSHLRQSSEEFEKHMLGHEQLNDRLRHYEAQNNSQHILQHELQEAKQTIVNLTNEINVLKNSSSVQMVQQIPHDSQINAVDVEEAATLEKKLEEMKLRNLEFETREEQTVSDPTPELDEVTILRKKLAELEQRNDELVTKLQQSNTSADNRQQEVQQSDEGNVVLDKEEAMRHLEEKFKRTMQDIADLTEEKQRLEHLVLQLQGETETIGEYVALYQQQRMMLKQKTMEKDQQLKQLASDREQIKVKLDKLNELIRKLVTEKGSIPNELLRHHENLTSRSENFCETHTKIHEEINKLNESNTENSEGVPNSETAEEIIALLSEIKTSNLVEPNSIHHCAWCSGQLITV